MWNICMKETDKYGRGIFATQDFNEGDLIEMSPVIVLPRIERDYIEKTLLSTYFFFWGEELEEVAISLGYGSLYNHSFTPNAKFVNNLLDQSIDFYAHRAIKAGEEITINYNGNPDDNSPLWFDVIE